MISAVLTSDQQNLCVALPADYIGVPLRVLIYSLEEEIAPADLPQSVALDPKQGTGDVSDLAGSLKISEERLQAFKQFVNEGRE